MSHEVLTITQISEYIRSMMDHDVLLTGLAVRGEISNYKVYPSGHHYFTLKDEAASLKCVMFRSHSARLRFRPENGMKIIAMGKISAYPRDGAYQLYCTGMVVDGAGDLNAAFEQLKAKLSAQGLFDPTHKKKLPAYPKCIGIITSSAGAAIHDMLRILRKRFPLTTVRLLPVRVQGAEAPGEITAAIEYANRYRLADLLIVGRGGGSIEDLWAFNDEQVAMAIYRSDIPIISAVGHEPDVTISDYVADVRAATPSNAAELAVPDQNALRQSLDASCEMLTSSLDKLLRGHRRHLQMLGGSVSLTSPMNYIRRKRESLQHMQTRMTSAESGILNRYSQKFMTYTAKLDAMSPLKVFTRGYAMAQTMDRCVVRTVGQLCKGDKVNVSVSDGTFTAEVIQIGESQNGTDQSDI